MDCDALILGGGFAGLSCGVALAKGGARVVLLEKKPHLGGRAYSFTDTETGQAVDNGQHLFMGCYRHTRRFLAEIKTGALLKFSEKIRVDYADASGLRSVLNCPEILGAPLHLVGGVLGLRGLSLGDKLGLRRLDAYMRKVKSLAALPAELDAVTVRQWLDGLGQSRRAQERLFDPIAWGALNDDPQVAAATGFVQVLREIFYHDVESTRFGLSRVGLSDLYTTAARDFIEARGGRVVLSSKVVALEEEEGKISGVRMESGEKRLARFTVSTLAPWDLSRIYRPVALRGDWEGLKPAPIISICLWLDAPILDDEPFVGMLGTETQWVFNKSLILGKPVPPGQYLSLVISGAHRYVSWDPKELLEIARKDLARCFPRFEKAKILKWKVIKEPFATLSPVPGSDALRPEPGSGMPGFYFAGDWTRTGLPATIESAVASGHKVAEEILAGR